MKIIICFFCAFLFISPLTGQENEIKCIKPESSPSYTQNQTAQVDEGVEFYFQNTEGKRLYLGMSLEQAADIMGVQILKAGIIQEREWVTVYPHGPFEFITINNDPSYENIIIGIYLVKKDPNWKLMPQIIDLGFSKQDIIQALGNALEGFSEDPNEWIYIYDSNTNLKIYFENDRVVKIELWMGM